MPHVDFFIHMCGQADTDCGKYSGSHNMPYHDYLFSLSELEELGVYSDPRLTYHELRSINFLRAFKYDQDPVLEVANNCTFMMYLKDLDLAFGPGSKWQWLLNDDLTMYGWFAPAPLSDPSFAVAFWEWFMAKLNKYIMSELELP